MAVSAGHLAGRMETGSLGLVLTTAACSLVLPAILALHRTGSRRAAVMLAIAFAQSAVAGQGYMQVGLLFTLPTAALLLRPDLASIALFARRYALAAGLATLLAAPYLLPVLHFLPELGKHGDPYFRGGQSFAHVPLNLVVADPKFYQTDILGKLPNPFLYSIYVGWIPVLCALAAVFGVRNSGKGPVIAFLAAWAVGALWISTGTPFTLLANAPTSWVAETARGIRHPSVMAGLAVPAILALAAAAVDRAFAARAPRVAFAIGVGETPMRSLSLDLTLLIAIPLIIALADARSFSSVWISTTRLGPELRPVLEALRTPDLQWVQPPYGEQHWIQNAVGMGLKQASNQEPWTWKGHAPPEPVAQASRNGSRPGMTLRNVVDGMPIYTAPEGREYAAVTHPGGGRSVCTARGSGGDIDVGCNLLQPGVLTVKENYWSGWDAYVGGQSAPIGSGQWLEVDLADGVHTIQFRYRPWDVPLGFVLGLAGMGLAIAAWREERPGP